MPAQDGFQRLDREVGPAGVDRRHAQPLQEVVALWRLPEPLPEEQYRRFGVPRPERVPPPTLEAPGDVSSKDRTVGFALDRFTEAIAGPGELAGRKEADGLVGDQRDLGIRARLGR